MRNIQKRVLALLTLVILLMTAVVPALADDSISGLTFSGNNWREQNCKPSMLNFGYVRVPLGKTLQDMNNSNACNTVKKSIKASQVDALINDGMTFYIYAKFAGSNISFLYIDANLIVTAPDGRYYREDGTWFISDCAGGPWHFSWFFDVNNLLGRIMADNDGMLPKGDYDFSMFFNGDTFRTTTIKFK